LLRYKRGISVEDVQRAVQSLFDIGIALVPPSGELMRRTVAIASAFDITVYDATFAALAESLDGTFITADQHLAAHLTALRYVRFLGD
jgi:predicted nucleic acid-binding protein